MKKQAELALESLFLNLVCEQFTTYKLQIDLLV